MSSAGVDKFRAKYNRDNNVTILHRYAAAMCGGTLARVRRVGATKWEIRFGYHNVSCQTHESDFFNRYILDDPQWR